MNSLFGGLGPLVVAALAQGTPVESGAAAAPLADGLSGAGWAFMALSLLFVWGLALWCFRLVLTTPAHVDPGPAAKP